MGQSEIFDWLKDKCMKGNDTYFSVEEIEKGVGEHENRAARKLHKLYLFGYLDCCAETLVKGKPWNGWKKSYRCKKEYARVEVSRL